MATQAEMSKTIVKQIKAFRKAGGKIKKIKHGVSSLRDMSDLQVDKKLKDRPEWYARLKKQLNNIYVEHGDLGLVAIVAKLEELGMKTKKGHKFNSTSLSRVLDELGHKYVS